MKRLGLIFLFVGLLFAAGVLADVDDEFRRLTYYAEEYEIGNINYPQLVVNLASAREKLNAEFGAVNNFEGGLLRQEDIEDILGKPTEMTHWVWVEGEDREMKLDEDAPVWRRVVFDGRKMQIMLEVHPSVFSKKKLEGDDRAEFLEEFVGKIVYRLHFNIEFKEKETEVDFEEEIEKIGEMASDLSADFSKDKMEELAEKSVGVERKFEKYLRQSGGKCEDIIVSLLGRENQREVQKVVVWEIDFASGEDFDSVLRLEMCEECEWNWIGADLRIEGPAVWDRDWSKDNRDEDFRKKFEGWAPEEIKKEIENVVGEIEVSLDSEDFDEAFILSDKLRALNDVWNEKANNVWEEIDKEYAFREDLMSEEERQEFHENYGWIKLDQERRRAEEDLRERNFLERKQFYFELFAGSEKRDYSFEEKSWEKRLFEDFVKIEREVCDNNKDDNDDGMVDCADGMCGGSVCGRIEDGNESYELFCIEGECQARDEERREAVCGNNICEDNETETCVEDCFICVEHPAIECSGRVISGGEDENGCPLPPVCVDGDFCEVDDDCEFLCGEGMCVEGVCKVKELVGCEEGCAEGDENVVGCESGEKVVVKVCDGGMWKETGLKCEEGEGEEVEEEVRGEECETISDCGGENDVCSNGKCVALPEKVEESSDMEELEGSVEEGEDENIEETEVESEEQGEVSEDDEGGLVFGFLSFLSDLRVTGAVVGDGADDEVEVSTEEEVVVEEEEDVIDESNDEVAEEEVVEDEIAEEGEGDVNDDNVFEEHEDWEDEHREEDGRREREDEEMREEQERWEKENQERCSNDCQRPCVDKCIRDNCGDKMECDIDSESRKCEDECSPEETCIEKCMEGGDWWKEFEEEEIRENGVFTVGGNCRLIEGRSEGGLWFGGWGEVFEDLWKLKDGYYMNGGDDWCRLEFASAVERRQEFEKGFDNDFAAWFFEKHLANAAEDWESAQSGIYELYWNSVDNLMRMAHNSKCLGENDLLSLFDYELINVSYDTEYGSLEYWEEIKDVEWEELGVKKEGTVKIITPYMKIWIFPPKEFIKYEMGRAMEDGRFPGSPEEKMERDNEGGLTSEEKEKIKEDEKFMKKLTKILADYDGEMRGEVRLMDGEDVVFNLDVEVNEDDIFKVVPALPSGVEEGVRVEVDFNLIYDMIYEAESMKGGEIQSPPWDEMDRGFSFGEVVDGIKMFFKVRKIVNSAEYYPASVKGDVKDLFWNFAWMKMREGDGEGDKDKMKGEEGDVGKAALSDEELEELFNK